MMRWLRGLFYRGKHRRTTPPPDVDLTRRLSGSD